MRERSRRSMSLIRRIKKESLCWETVFTGHNAISAAAPMSLNYKLSPCGAAEGGEGGLTIAAWADINLFKLMEVSVLLCCGGMSSIPGHLL